VGDKVLPWAAGTLASKSAHERVSISPPELRGLSDEQLMARLQGGWREAMAFLFERYYRLVFSISAKILRDPAEAEDLAQDVFFEIYRKAGLFDPTKGTVKLWLIQYAYTRSLNRRRYLGLRSLNGDAPLVDGRWSGFEPHYSPNGWDGLTHGERTRVLKTAMDVLTEKQKLTLELAYFEGLLMREIATKMNEPIANVRNYYYRGLKKLRQALGESLCRSSEVASCR
jgi:RNA polymerase sigma-70 factor, ECF subfamily